MKDLRNQNESGAYFVDESDSDSGLHFLSEYSVFKNHSEFLLQSFQDIKARYGSIQAIPEDLLLEYNYRFAQLLDYFKDLKTVLQTVVNENTKFLEDLHQSGIFESAIHEFAVRKLENSKQKVEYYGFLQELHAEIRSGIDSLVH